MKTLIFYLIIIVLPTTCVAQVQDTMLYLKLKVEEGIAKLQSVQEIEGDKATLYDDANQWLFESFKSGKSVMQMSDKEQGVIIANAKTHEVFYSGNAEAGRFRYSMRLDFKDNKYRMTIDDIIYERGRMALGEGANYGADYPANWPKMGKKYNAKQWRSMKKQAMKQFNALAVSLYQYMTEKETGTDDDW